MKQKRILEQLDKDITSVLNRMEELKDQHSIPYLVLTDNKYGTVTEFIRKWIVPQAEITYGSYVRILAQLNEEKMQK